MKKLSRDEALETLKKGGDTSCFNDPVEWQKQVREDCQIDRENNPDPNWCHYSDMPSPSAYVKQNDL